MTQQFITARDAMTCLLADAAPPEMPFRKLADDVETELREMIQRLTDKYNGKE